MAVSLSFIAIFALKRFHWKKFELFWYTHHFFVIFFIFFSFHGSFCLIQPDRQPKCANAGAFWKYWIASGTIYLFERVLREWRSRQCTYISKVVLHPSQVVEVQIKKNRFRYKAGQYIFVNCPEVSLFQWHPFTLTSAPEEDCLSIHVRVVGDWTRAYAKALGCDTSSKQPKGLEPGVNKLLPRVLVDGPFGSASEDVFKYEVTMLVGAGIGVTPFASVLKSIWYRCKYPTKGTKLRKVYFFWICRDYQAFEWFQDLLKAIEEEDINHLIDVHVYLTGQLKQDEIGNLILNDDEGNTDALTGLKTPTHYGRPNFDQIFETFVRDHQETDIGVFFCGPKPLSRLLSRTCDTWSGDGEADTKFIYNQENF